MIPIGTQGVMTMLRDFAGKLDQYGGALAAIAKDVRDLQV